MEESGYEPEKWPYVAQTFKAGEVQSPINILPLNAYNASLSSLLYFRYWREDSVEIKIGHNGRARKSVNFILQKSCLKISLKLLKLFLKCFYLT